MGQRNKFINSNKHNINIFCLIYFSRSPLFKISFSPISHKLHMVPKCSWCLRSPSFDADPSVEEGISQWYNPHIITSWASVYASDLSRIHVDQNCGNRSTNNKWFTSRQIRYCNVWGQ